MAKEMTPELHLFVLWPNARNHKKIKELIKSKFTICYDHNFEILKENMAAFLSKFYGIKLPSIKAKLGHTGTGSINLIVVKDWKPVYGKRIYHSKPTEVNTNTFDVRLACRNLSGDPDTIHGTINASEIYHDLPLLVGENTAEEIQYYYGGI